jgi:transposase
MGPPIRTDTQTGASALAGAWKNMRGCPKGGGGMATGKYQKWLTPDGLMLLTAWARDGLSDEQLARKIGISTSTLYEWKKRHQEISEALSRGKEPVDVEVENALHKLALGYTVPVRKTFKVKRVFFDDKGRRCEAEELAVGYDEVHVPANVNAQKFWLANRKPEAWREKAETGVSVDVEDLSPLVELLGGPGDE